MAILWRHDRPARAYSCFRQASPFSRSRALQLRDMLFTATIAAAMACGGSLIFEESSRIYGLASDWDFSSVPQLWPKVRAGVVLAGGGGRVVGRIFQKMDAFSSGSLHPLSVFIFFVTALPWYFLCARRNPDFLNVFIFQHNFERFLTPVFHHVKPWWIFPPFSFFGFCRGAHCSSRLAFARRQLRSGVNVLRAPDSICLLDDLRRDFFQRVKIQIARILSCPAVPTLVLLLAAAASRIRCTRDDAARGVTMGLGATWLALVSERRILAASPDSHFGVRANVAAFGIFLPLRRQAARLLPLSVPRNALLQHYL